MAADELPPAFKRLARVLRFLQQRVHPWDVLATLTPSEYSAIRPSSESISGFQPWQDREIESRLGNKNPAMLKLHAYRADIHARLQQALAAPSLYDEAPAAPLRPIG